jgi:hypothetical protein
LIFTTLFSTDVFAAKPGEKLGNALYTDIKTYINSERIPCYSIGGKSVIFIKDLENYGFDAVYSRKDRTTVIAYKPKKKITPINKFDGTGKKSGTAAFGYVYTDIAAIIKNKRAECFNVKGYNAIYFSELAEIYADSYIWDKKDRTSKITLVKPWVMSVYDMSGLSKTSEVPVIHKGEYSFTFKNQSPNDGTVDFVISDYDGDYFVAAEYSDDVYRVGPHIFELGSDYLMIYTQYSDIFTYSDYRPGLEFFGVINKNTCIHNGEIRGEDTPESRAALAEVFRVYINGMQIGGKMTSHQGNNSVYYYFNFDKYYSLDKIDTIRLELGYKK